VQIVANVVAVNPKTRSVTLKGPRGNTLDLTVADPEQFANVKRVIRWSPCTPKPSRFPWSRPPGSRYPRRLSPRVVAGNIAAVLIWYSVG
jgi:hypothetical protein